jgi:hypothetical protein
VGVELSQALCSTACAREASRRERDHAASRFNKQRLAVFLGIGAAPQHVDPASPRASRLHGYTQWCVPDLKS